jgi:hypothetical protein
MYRKPSSSCGRVSIQLRGDCEGMKGSSYLVLLIDGAHERGGWRQHFINEDEDGLFGAQLDALADDIDELADSEIGRDEVLLLVDGRNVRLLDLLADNLLIAQSVCIYFGALESV